MLFFYLDGDILPPDHIRKSEPLEDQPSPPSETLGRVKGSFMTSWNVAALILWLIKEY